MKKQKTKIPLATISIIDPMQQTNQNNYGNDSEDLSFDNPLFELDKLENFSKVAHLTLHKVNQHLYPASAELFWIKNAMDETVDGEDGVSFQYKPAEVLESGSFNVEYAYDCEIDDEIPKYIVIN